MNHTGIILLEHKEAKNPYQFMMTGTKIYSVEELSYYIYHNIYILTEEAFTFSLVKWMREEAGLSVLADKMQHLLLEGNDLKDIVTTILCSNDFYTEKEIKHLLDVIDEISEYPLSQRRKLRADAYMNYRNYHRAAVEYEAIMKEEQKTVFSQEEIGDMLHNLGVAHVHIASLQEACQEFKQAYTYNHRDESLEYYLFALWLSRQNALFERECIEYGVSKERRQLILDKLRFVAVEAENLSIYRKLKELEGLKERGYVGEYYKGIDYILSRWKQEYKKDIG